MSAKSNQSKSTSLPPATFAKHVTEWQQQHGRHDLPWQQHRDPYHVLVSELMLQQTQVRTVIPYFNNWLKQFPNITTLASAHEDQVLSAWQGLGYYSRARNLHRAAQYVVTELDGEIPDSPELLREVPGVGPYTAGAITAFAFNKPAAIVDGNVKRLFSRYFGIHGDLSRSNATKKLWQLAEQYTPSEDNRVYAQGLLDLGATICKARNPLCQNCPLHDSCYAVQTDRVDELPMRKTKAQLPHRDGHFILALNDHSVVLEQRAGNGIWPRLWCLPEVAEAPITLPVHGSFKHVFSHYRLNATVYIANDNTTNRLLNGAATQYVPISNLQQFGLPAPIRKYLDTHSLSQST